MLYRAGFCPSGAFHPVRIQCSRRDRQSQYPDHDHGNPGGFGAVDDELFGSRRVRSERDGRRGRHRSRQVGGLQPKCGSSQLYRFRREYDRHCQWRSGGCSRYHFSKHDKQCDGHFLNRCSCRKWRQSAGCAGGQSGVPECGKWGHFDQPAVLVCNHNYDISKRVTGLGRRQQLHRASDFPVDAGQYAYHRNCFSTGVGEYEVCVCKLE